MNIFFSNKKIRTGITGSKSACLTSTILSVKLTFATQCALTARMTPLRSSLCFTTRPGKTHMSSFVVSLWIASRLFMAWSSNFWSDCGRCCRVSRWLLLTWAFYLLQLKKVLELESYLVTLRSKLPIPSFISVGKCTFSLGTLPSHREACNLIICTQQLSSHSKHGYTLTFSISLSSVFSRARLYCMCCRTVSSLSIGSYKTNQPFAVSSMVQSGLFPKCLMNSVRVVHFVAIVF